MKYKLTQHSVSLESVSDVIPPFGAKKPMLMITQDQGNVVILWEIDPARELAALPGLNPQLTDKTIS